MAADWHVTRQDNVPIVSSNGKLVTVKRVWFRVDTDPAAGHEDYVDTEDEPGYSARVASLIQSKVDEIKAVASL